MIKRHVLLPEKNDILSGYFDERPPEKVNPDQTFIYNEKVFRRLCGYYWDAYYANDFAHGASNFFSYRAKAFEAEGEYKRALHDIDTVLKACNRRHLVFLGKARIFNLLGRSQEAVGTLLEGGYYKMGQDGVIFEKPDYIIQALINQFKSTLFKDDPLQAYDIEIACIGFPGTI